MITEDRETVRDADDRPSSGKPATSRRMVDEFAAFARMPQAGDGAARPARCRAGAGGSFPRGPSRTSTSSSQCREQADSSPVRSPARIAGRDQPRQERRRKPSRRCGEARTEVRRRLARPRRDASAPSTATGSTIEVIDNGVGLAQAEPHRACSSPTSRPRAHKGTGLGLAIVQKSRRAARRHADARRRAADARRDRTARSSALRCRRQVDAAPKFTPERQDRRPRASSGLT